MTILPLTDEIINAKKVYHDRKPSKIKELRLAHRWTQQELANRTRISVSMITHYELGTRALPDDKKKILAKVLGCKMSEL